MARDGRIEFAATLYQVLARGNKRIPLYTAFGFVHHFISAEIIVYTQA